MSTPSLQERLAAVKTAQRANNNAAQSVEAAVANAEASANAVETSDRVFFGEFAPSIAYLTPSGKVVHFYQGYCIATDTEMVEYCKTIPGAREVTDEVNIADVPRPDMRSRSRNWAGDIERTVITPGELLARAVRVQTTAQLPQSAESNSGATGTGE